MNHSMSFYHRLAIATVSITLLSGCKPPAEGEKASEEYMRDPSGLILPIPKMKREETDSKSIVFLLRDGDDPYQSVQANELGQAARSTSGYTVRFEDARGQAATQVEQLRALGAKKPHAVLINPVDPKAVTTEIGNLRRAGVFVIGLDSRFEDEVCDTLVYTDQKKIGAAAGDLIVQALKRKAKDLAAPTVEGRVIQIQLDESLPVSKDRNDGFVSALKAESGLVLVHDGSAKGAPLAAAGLFEEALRLQKQIDAVYVQNDLMARGVHEAAEKAGVREQLLIVGTDGTGGPGGGLEMIRQAHLDATVHQPLLVNLAWQILALRDKDAAFKPKARYEIEPVAITPKNVSEIATKGIAMPKP